MAMFQKHISSADAVGRIYEMKLAMLFLMRGTVAHSNRQIDSFRLGVNLEVAHPFDDIVFIHSREGRSELVMVQTKHKKTAQKNIIDWSTLLHTKREYSLKRYMDRYLQMNLEEDEILRGPFARIEVVLYTNAPFKSNKKALVERVEANPFYKSEGKTIQILFNDEVYKNLGVNSDFTLLTEEFENTIKRCEFNSNILIYEKYRNHLQNFVIGFKMKENAVNQSLFSQDFLLGKLPEEILALREAIFERVRISSENEAEMLARLMATKVKVSVTFTGEPNVKANLFLLNTLNESVVLDFLDHFRLAHDQPDENDLELTIKREIASFYWTSKDDADKIYTEVYMKIMNWWKDGSYYLTEYNDWFDEARKNLSGSPLIQAVEAMKTRLNNMKISYKGSKAFEDAFESNRMINVVCDEATGILNCAFVYNEIQKRFSGYFYIFLDQKSFKSLLSTVLGAFRDYCNLLIVYSHERIPLEFVQILNENKHKRLVWIGSAQDEATQISLSVRFKDLTDKAQDCIFKTKLSLQGEIVSLADVIERSDMNEAITDELLTCLVSDEITEIGRSMFTSDPFYIQQKLTRKSCMKIYKPNDLRPDCGSIFVLISALPGMGKSTLLSNMKMNNFHWNYLINLRETCNILKTMKFQIDLTALEFLRMAIKMDESEYRLFKMAYEKRGKVALLFDGFDEIAPTYKDVMLKIFRSLRQSKVVEVWVTTRPSLEQELEMELDTVAYRIEPFSHEDQKNYLMKFWPNSDASTVENYVKKFSEAIGNSADDIASIPLHLKVISEMSESFSNEDYNMFKLYEQLMQVKFFRVEMQEKCGIDLNSLMLREILDERYGVVKRYHENMAILSLFNESELSQLLTSYEINEVVSTNIVPFDRCGIIISSVDDSTIFVHRTFAEFFAASWLVGYYMKHKETKNFSKMEIYRNMYREENILLRMFFDYALCSDAEACRSVISNDLEKIKTMTTDELRKKDIAGRTAYHLGKAYGRKEICEYLLSKEVDWFSQDDIFKYDPTQYENFQE